jgi:CTP:molybdopterin cytidylyltransferase MocA
MTEVAILLLAAGASKRMKTGDKLLEFIDGAPLILRQLRRCCAASSDVTVVLHATDAKRRAWITDSPARIITTPERAMSASLRAGLAACKAPALMVVLADMPDVTTQDMERLIAAHHAHSGQIIQATATDGRPGQPVIFPASRFAELALLRGDTGAKAIVQAHGAHRVALPGMHALTDLDTPEDWAAWRARQGPATIP